MRSLGGDPALRPLGVARLAFGIVFVLRTTPVLMPLHPRFLEGGNGWLGWPDGGIHIPVAGIALPAGVVATLVVARTIAAILLALGYRTAITGLVAAACGYLVLAQDAFGYFHHLHLLYLGAFLFAVVDGDAAVAIRPTVARSPASSLALMRSFAASIYVWAALGKLLSEWGTGAALARFRASGAIGLATGHDALVELAVVVAELALGLGLLVPRTRRVALVAAFAMHVAFELFLQVDSIGWQMCALLLVFTRSARPRPATP